MSMSIPVYLFTGFLDAGKTAFIQETLEDPGFNTGEKTLVLLCEEGEMNTAPKGSQAETSAFCRWRSRPA